MKTVGFPISHKENEKRRTILPNDIIKLDHPELIYVEKGYGEILGISDSEYLLAGCNVTNRKEILKQDILCEPKIGDASYLGNLSEGQIVFGWIHATQNKVITDSLLKSKVTVYAWEKMYEENRHVFWRNNELAGEAAVLHAFQCFGIMPYETNVAVIGNGNTARGAIKALNMFGAVVTQYNKHTENLLRKEINNYDVIVNCVLWDVGRKDHIIGKSDLKNMKKNSMIIDVSCDKHGGIETSEPTTIDDPIYFVDGVCHYAVDHTPTLYYKTFTTNNSRLIVPYINKLQKGEKDLVLQNALIIEKGTIIDEEINKYQKRY